MNDELLIPSDRYREFTMAEIEHFVDPLCKDHDRFAEVEHIVLSLLPKDVQSAGKTDISHVTVGDAIKSVRILTHQLFI